MLILGNPDVALGLSSLGADGVGLARLEFIISRIGMHPQAALDYPQMDPADPLRKQLASASVGYASPRDFYVSRLAEGVSTIAAAFYPKPVVVRMSDFKSNEYIRCGLPWPVGGREDLVVASATRLPCLQVILPCCVAVSQSPGGRQVRAGGGEPDVGFPRRLPLLPPEVRGCLQARVRGNQSTDPASRLRDTEQQRPGLARHAISRTHTPPARWTTLFFCSSSRRFPSLSPPGAKR